MEDAIVWVLMIFMLATAVMLAKLRNLFAVIILSGIYSLFGALIYVVMDAVDVAFTEAAVGAGVSTVLMLGTLGLMKNTEEKPHSKKRTLTALAAVLGTGGLLIYATLDMPHYGDPNAPIHHHVANRYVDQSGAEVGPPNIVTSVLASYRGFDTLGETVVVFTAAIGVLVIIGRSEATAIRRRKKKTGADEETAS